MRLYNRWEIRTLASPLEKCLGRGGNGLSKLGCSGYAVPAGGLLCNWGFRLLVLPGKWRRVADALGCRWMTSVVCEPGMVPKSATVLDSAGRAAENR